MNYSLHSTCSVNLSLSYLTSCPLTDLYVTSPFPVPTSHFSIDLGRTDLRSASVANIYFDGGFDLSDFGLRVVSV